MKLVIVSDIHINSHFSKEEKFLELMKKIEADILVINGDLYDLYIGPPLKDVRKTIRKNKNIKKVIYIRGNHDFYIGDYLKRHTILDKYEIADIVITHGHQYDFLSETEPTGKGFGKWSVVFRNWVEKTFNFNVRIAMKKISFGLIDWMLFKAQKKAAEAYPGKKVIIGHTHAPICKYPYYNTGCMVDDYFTYIIVYIDDKGNSSINLVQE